MRTIQNTVILEALKSGQSITPIDALKRFGCLPRGARIHDLRHGTFDGTAYPIDRVMESKNGKRYARYSLAQKGATNLTTTTHGRI
jgi:hypothetical protein